MKLSDFKIGKWFWTATGRWKVLDVGTWTVIAVKEDVWNDAMNDPFLSGREELVNYAIIFDHYDFGGCCETNRFD